MAALFVKEAESVLSLNARALHYTTAANVRAAIRLANDKLGTKRTLQKAGVPVPRLYAVVASYGDLKRFRWTKLPPSFVVKPASSSGGGGVSVIFGRNKKGNWVKADKTEIFIPELRNHVLNILDGNFSRGNVPDAALFEQRVRNHAALKPYCVKGVPDIRVLVYNLVPIMAMLRLPTEESGGRANLHTGGIGVGIELAEGITTTAIHHGQLIETLPSQRLPLAGIRIPEWQKILHMAVETAQATGLRFAGVDIALDRDDGPVVLEINARPGLDIQLANMAPLRSRLRRVEGLNVSRATKGVQLGMNLFGTDKDQEITDISGKIVLRVEEEATIFDAQGQTHSLKVKIDTGAWRTTLDEALAQKYGLHKTVLEHKKVWGALGQQVRPIVELSFSLRDRLIKTNAFMVDRSHMKYDMIIGRRDLAGFLVDPSP